MSKSIYIYGFHSIESQLNSTPECILNVFFQSGRSDIRISKITSILNKWILVHSAKNVFVTDGACMTSASCVNPSITYMAIPARAANYAINEFKKGNL